MLVYIIRHGETDLNSEGRLQGRIDHSLNQKGRDLAVETGEALKDVHFDLCISSPLKRAYETAELFLSANSEPDVPIITDDRLIEYDWGEIDGLGCTPDNFEVPDPNYNLFFTDPLHYKPSHGGETLLDVVARTGQFMVDLMENEKYKDKTVLISTHGCALRGLMNPFCEDPMNFWQDTVPQNCCINIIELKDGRGKILTKDKIYYDSSLVVNPYEAVK